MFYLLKRRISIHALRGEGDIPGRAGLLIIDSFQSTPSVGRATNNTDINIVAKVISIHALRGEGDDIRPQALVEYNISIHALRGEGDNRQKIRSFEVIYFNPRPPWGGRLFRVVRICK